MLALVGRLAASGAGKKLAASAGKKALSAGAEKGAKKIAKDKFFNREEKSEGGDLRSRPPKIAISPQKLLPSKEIKDSPEKVNIQKDSGDDSIKESFNKIDNTLKGIISYLDKENQLKKSQSDQVNKQIKLQNKERQENKLENRRRSFGSGPKINLPGDSFGIGKFFKNIIIGSLILAVMKNIQSIIEFFKNTYNTIKEFVVKLGEFLSPIWDSMKWFVGEGVKLVAKLMGIPEENLDETDILNNISQIAKQIPGLKQLFEGVNTTLDSVKNNGKESIKKAGKDEIDLQTQGKSSKTTVLSSENNGEMSPPSELTTSGDGGGTAASTPGSYEVKLAKILANYEGLRTQAYPDAIHGWKVPTIGIGATYYPKGFRLTGRVKQGDVITKEEAYWIKAQHIKDHRKRIFGEIGSSEYNKLPDGVKAALESKAFNYGSLGSTLSNLVKAANATKDYSGISSYFRNTLARHNNGVNSWRRNDEAGLIDSGRSARVGVSFGNINSTQIQNFDPSKKYAAGDLVMKDGEVRKFDGMGWAAVDGPSAQDLSVPPPTPIQIDSPVQGQSSNSVSGISESADYEMPGGNSGAVIMPMQNSSGSPNMSGKSGGIMPIGTSKKDLLNSYYQAQLVGFLYKQG